MSGERDEFTGRAKQQMGDAVGDEELKEEGERQEAAGKVKGAIDSAADKLKESADSLRNKMNK